MRTPAVVAASVVVVVLALPAGAAPPPQQQIAQLKRQVAALKTQVKQLRKQKSDLTKVSESAWRRELALRSYAATRGACGVTQPNGSQPPDGNIGGELVHGNGSLWVAMPPSNVVVTEPSAGGTIQTKYPWWRSVSGTLRIEGRRLDGPAVGLTATDVPDGYGVVGFQASAVTFPTEGCWEVTGRAGDASLTFVTLVLKSIG
jgi:hypothetical protein